MPARFGEAYHKSPGSYKQIVLGHHRCCNPAYTPGQRYVRQREKAIIKPTHKRIYQPPSCQLGI